MEAESRLERDPLDIVIRVYRPGDELAIAEIFSEAVHKIASEVYPAEQCEAWASSEINYEHWHKRCLLKRPFVAELEGRIAGFLELDPDGHIDCAYVNPEFQRQGVVSALVEHAKTVCFDFGLSRMYVEASICAKPMFEKLGFRVTGEIPAQIRGHELANFQMEFVESQQT